MPPGEVVLYHEDVYGNRMGWPVMDGRLGLAVVSLIGVIEHAAPDRNDPTQGVWYCERIQR